MVGAVVGAAGLVVVAVVQCVPFGVHAARLPFGSAAARSVAHLGGLSFAKRLADRRQPVEPGFDAATVDRVRVRRSSIASARTSRCP